MLQVGILWSSVLLRRLAERSVDFAQFFGRWRLRGGIVVVVVIVVVFVVFTHFNGDGRGLEVKRRGGRLGCGNLENILREERQNVMMAFFLAGVDYTCLLNQWLAISG